MFLGTADPESLALGRCDLVPDPLGGDFSLELSSSHQSSEEAQWQNLTMKLIK